MGNLDKMSMLVLPEKYLRLHNFIKVGMVKFYNINEEYIDTIIMCRNWKNKTVLIRDYRGERYHKIYELKLVAKLQVFEGFLYCIKSYE